MISYVSYDDILGKGWIDDDDVLVLRRKMHGGDFRISEKEADALFRLNDACEANGNAWPEFFIEAVVDFVVNQAEPRGYVSLANSDWLTSRISQSGIVKSPTELEALIKVMDVAQDVPEKLERFALEQVRHAILEGTGRTSSGHDLSPGRIGKAEVDIVRRILYACGGANGIAVSRAEAELLFDINDAITDVSSDASWPDLFVKAVANYLMAARGYTPPSRVEALRRAAWLDDHETSVGDFFGKILAGGLRGVLAAYSKADDDKVQEKSAEIAASEIITEEEANWLVERIGANGILDDTERVLLVFIKTESPDIHPRLKPLIDKVA